MDFRKMAFYGMAFHKMGILYPFMGTSQEPAFLKYFKGAESPKKWYLSEIF